MWISIWSTALILGAKISPRAILNVITVIMSSKLYFITLWHYFIIYLIHRDCLSMLMSDWNKISVIWLNNNSIKRSYVSFIFNAAPIRMSYSVIQTCTQCISVQLPSVWATQLSRHTHNTCTTPLGVSYLAIQACTQYMYNSPQDELFSYPDIHTMYIYTTPLMVSYHAIQTCTQYMYNPIRVYCLAIQACTQYMYNPIRMSYPAIQACT